MNFVKRFSMINRMRQKVKSFLHVFTNSLLPQSHYYKTVLKTKFSFSFKYFVSLVLLLNAIIIVIGVIILNPFTLSDVISNLSNNLQAYPKNLTVILNKGHLMTTYNQPYFFWMNYQNKTAPLLVIDENALPQKISEYSSYILLTANELVTRDVKNQGAITELPLSYLPNQTIDKNMVDQVESNLRIIQSFLLPLYVLVLIVLAIILPLISFSVTLAYILVASLLIYVVFKIWGRTKKQFARVHYKKIVHLSFHAVTLPILLDYGLGIFGVRTAPVSFFFFLLLVLFIFAWIYESYRDQEMNTQPAHHPHHRV